MFKRKQRKPDAAASGFKPALGWDRYGQICRKQGRRLVKAGRPKARKAPEPAPAPISQEDQPPAAQVLEAVLFAAPEPVSAARIFKQLKPFYPKEILQEALTGLTARFEGNDSAVQLVKVAGGYQLATKPAYYEYVSAVLGRKKTISLSPAGLETLSLIAYKQPISKADIEAVRGVQSSGVLKSLIELDLVKVVGREDNIGRAFIYGTTRKFLQHFGLGAIRDLPRAKA